MKEEKYIIIHHQARGAWDVKIEQPGREDFRRRYIGYTKQEAERDARRETGTTGAHLLRVEW